LHLRNGKEITRKPQEVRTEDLHNTERMWDNFGALWRRCRCEQSAAQRHLSSNADYFSELLQNLSFFPSFPSLLFSISNCNCNSCTCIAPPTGRLRVHHRVNPYLGTCRQNETKMFSDHDKTSRSIAAVSASSVARSMLFVAVSLLYNVYNSDLAVLYLSYSE